MKLLKEAKIWSMAWGMAGFLAGAGLGLLVAQGAYLRVSLTGAVVGAGLGLVGGAVAALILEILWLIGLTIGRRLNRFSQISKQRE